MNLKDFMAEEKPVSRWFVLRIAIIGALCGALLATVFLLGAVRLN